MSFVGGISCVLVGSTLYVIGGKRADTMNLSNQIHCLNTLNPADGWRACNPLPFWCQYAKAEVAGNFISLFPELFDFYPHIDDESIWAYVYDTIGQTCTPVLAPPDFRPFLPPLSSCHRVIPPGCCFTLDGSESVPFYLLKDKRVYRHDPVQNSWNLQHNFCPLPGRINRPYTVSNGIVYGCECDIISDSVPYLYAYDVAKSKLTFKIQLPEIDKLDFKELHTSVFLVSIADSKLCLIRHKKAHKPRKSIRYYAKILVSLDPFPTATLLEQNNFEMDPIDGVNNCLTFDSYTGLNEEILPINTRIKQDAFGSKMQQLGRLAAQNNHDNPENRDNFLIIVLSGSVSFLIETTCKNNIAINGQSKISAYSSEEAYPWKTELISLRTIATCPSYERLAVSPSSTPVVASSHHQGPMLLNHRFVSIADEIGTMIAADTCCS